MFVIGEAIVEDPVAQVSFECNLSVCKGVCCCLEGGRGAPLEDEEIQEIEAALPIVSRYLTTRSLGEIASSGPFEGTSGNFATTCIDNRECVFVYRDEGIAKCAFERGYSEGLISWPKPLSCHLFPIRISRNGSQVLRYEEIEECAGGRRNGRAKGTPLYTFLKHPLIRRFGEGWYDSFTETCRSQLDRD